MKLFGKFSYKEITKPELIIYTQTFCDEAGNLSRHPGAPLWPETMLNTVTFSEEGANQTRVTVITEPYEKASPAENEAFRLEKGGMAQGWSGSFDELEELLSR